MNVSEFFKGFLASILRGLLTGVVGYFTGKGWITGFQGETITVIIIATVIFLISALMSKYNIKYKIEVALGLPAGASTEQFQKALEDVKKL